MLRKKSNREDNTREGYRKLVLEQQQELDPKIVKQLVSEIGNGVPVVVGPMVLKDLFGFDSSCFGEPAFMKNDVSKQAALQALVDAMTEAENERALNAVLFVFLCGTGLNRIDLMCAGGQKVKLSWEEGRRRTKSYDFSDAVGTDCKRWANEGLAQLLGATE